MIFTWGDIRRGTLAIVLVIVPTVLLGTYIGPALQSYHITGQGLWELKQTNVPDEVIGPVQELRLQPFFFKFRLISEIKSRIANPELFNKYQKKNRGSNTNNFQKCCGIYFSCYHSVILFCFMVHNKKMVSKWKSLKRKLNCKT